jgi:hypothetical protein
VFEVTEMVVAYVMKSFMLKAGRSEVRVQVRTLIILIYLILPAAPCPWDLLIL